MNLIKTSKFPTYPNGSSARSISVESMKKLNEILKSVSDQDEVPAWVLMLLSQAMQNIQTAEVFISYFNSKGNTQ